MCVPEVPFQQLIGRHSRAAEGGGYRSLGRFWAMSGSRGSIDGQGRGPICAVGLADRGQQRGLDCEDHQGRGSSTAGDETDLDVLASQTQAAVLDVHDNLPDLEEDTQQWEAARVEINRLRSRMARTWKLGTGIARRPPRSDRPKLKADMEGTASTNSW